MRLKRPSRLELNCPPVPSSSLQYRPILLFSQADFWMMWWISYPGVALLCPSTGGLDARISSAHIHYIHLDTPRCSQLCYGISVWSSPWSFLRSSEFDRNILQMTFSFYLLPALVDVGSWCASMKGTSCMCISEASHSQPPYILTVIIHVFPVKKYIIRTSQTTQEAKFIHIYTWAPGEISTT